MFHNAPTHAAAMLDSASTPYSLLLNAFMHTLTQLATIFCIVLSSITKTLVSETFHRKENNPNC